MIYSGVLPNGEEVSLPAPCKAQFDSSADAPADSFSGVFPVKRNRGSLTGLKIRNGGGELFFDGTIDIRREISSAGGRLLKISSRSRAGLLLDSEALPQIYDYPAMATIYEKHIRPYGFSGWKGNSRVFDRSLRVVKGMSEWQVASLFCETFLLVTPRVRGGIFDASGQSPGGKIQFGGRGGLPYFSAEIRNRYCDRYSQIFAPSGTEDGYVSAAKDAKAAALGIVRNRCLTNSSKDAAAILEAADRKAFAVTVDCPGGIGAEIGSPASLEDPFLGSVGGLAVSEIRCVLGTGGTTTRYVLRRE
jgi:hypothetical protein